MKHLKSYIFGHDPAGVIIEDEDGYLSIDSEHFLDLKRISNQLPQTVTLTFEVRPKYFNHLPKVQRFNNQETSIIPQAEYTSDDDSIIASSLVESLQFFYTDKGFYAIDGQKYNMENFFLYHHKKYAEVLRKDHIDKRISFDLPQDKSFYTKKFFISQDPIKDPREINQNFSRQEKKTPPLIYPCGGAPVWLKNNTILYEPCFFTFINDLNQANNTLPIHYITKSAIEKEWGPLQKNIINRNIVIHPLPDKKELLSLEETILSGGITCFLNVFDCSNKTVHQKFAYKSTGYSLSLEKDQEIHMTFTLNNQPLK